MTVITLRGGRRFSWCLWMRVVHWSRWLESGPELADGEEEKDLLSVHASSGETASWGENQRRGGRPSQGNSSSYIPSCRLFLIPAHTFLAQKSQTLQPYTQVPLCPSSVTSTCSKSTITNPSATCLKPPFTPSAPPWPAYSCLSPTPVA